MFSYFITKRTNNGVFVQGSHCFFAVVVNEGMCYTGITERKRCLTLWDLNPSWLHQRMRRVWCGFGGTDCTSSLFLIQDLPEIPRCVEFYLTRGKTVLTLFKQRHAQLRKITSITCCKIAGLVLVSKLQLMRVNFHSINFVSPNSPLDWIFSRFLQVQANELFHHEGTAVNVGNSWPNTYSCWDWSSRLSLFITKLEFYWRHWRLCGYELHLQTVPTGSLWSHFSI